MQVLEQDGAALRMVREVVEKAPPGIAYIMLSGDMQGLVLYANDGARALLVGLEKDREGPVGRCVLL